MGFFNFGNKKAARQQESAPMPAKNLKPAKESEPKTKKPASMWNDPEYLRSVDAALKRNPGKSAMQVIAETEQELAEKKQQPKTPKSTYESPWITTTHSNGWEIEIRKDNGKPDIYMKNGKEWFDAAKTWSSPSKEYFLHNGFDGKGNEGLALTSKTAGLRIRKTEDFIETAIVTDNGIGYALTDEGVLYILTVDAASQRKLCENYGLNAYMLTPQFCAVIYDADSDDDQEIAYLKVILLESLNSWKKKIRYRADYGKTLTYNIEQSGNTIKAIMPDQSTHEFTIDGKLNK